jgi:hypothetical protein
MNKLAGLLFVVALGLIAYGLKPKPRRLSASSIPPSAMLDGHSERIVAGLNAAGGKDLAHEAFARKKAGVERSARLAEVVHSCLESYHRDSCLDHYIKCGAGCRPLSPDEKFAVIQKDYWNLMRERGLLKQ